MRVDKIQRIRLVYIVSPHRLGKAHFIDDPAGVDYKIIKQVELLAVQLQGFSVYLYLPFVGVEQKVSKGDGHISLRLPPTYQ